MKQDKKALYIGDHKIAYRAIRNGIRGLLYKKGNEECFCSLDEFILDVLNGPYEEAEKKNK